jgi:uncharacterized protein (TIGR04255 family)
MDGISYSQLGQYDEWAKFRDRAMEAARSYLALPGVERVKRLALRYINVIRFSESKVTLEEYLPACPIVPAGLPQTIAGFFQRVVLPIPEHGLTAIITQALEDPPQPTPSVILDVDVFTELALPPSDPSWPKTFEKIREWKNRIFFEFINEKTVTLYL